jgi:predicted NAD-dependent protein-ADP-ribosyltransferase YbiA (DUF1768 family)
LLGNVAREKLVPEPTMPERIDQFRGRYFFLSNFSLGSVNFEGDVYPSVEHAFAAAKTLDPELRAEVRHANLAAPAISHRLHSANFSNPETSTSGWLRMS